MKSKREVRIEQIIDQRKNLVGSIERARKNIENLSRSLQNLEAKRVDVIQQMYDQETSNYLQNLSFDNLIKQMEQECEKLGNLEERFSKSTLNIGVVGRMRQGKSTLLQSLTGLSNDEIPARPGKACTACRSTIIHDPNGQIKATITFHTESSFLLEIIHPYFDKLSIQKKPANLGEFSNYDFSKNEFFVSNNATNKTVYERLVNDYYRGLEGYRSCLGSEPFITSKKEEIKIYVSQERDSNNKLEDYKHLAVRHVQISCQFPQSNLGKLALVDVPGMGDFKLGDEELMLKTLGQEVDIVLFVRKPDKSGYQWDRGDTDLYDKANQALNDLDDRSFMILNLDQSKDNQKACESQKADLDLNKSIAMKFAKSCIIADCSDKATVGDVVLEPILHYLEKEIINLDKKYLDYCQVNIATLHHEIDVKLHQSSNALDVFSDEMRVFKEYFSGIDRRTGIWNDLTSGLGELRNELKQARQQEDSSFKERVIATIRNTRSDRGIPEVQDIKNQEASLGGYEARYYEYLEEIRSHLSFHFLLLDGDLQNSLELAKKKIRDVLVKKTKLGNLSNADGSQFFIELVNKLSVIQQKNIVAGFQMIGQFNVSFSGMIQRLIRPHLEILNPRVSNTLNKPVAIDLEPVAIDLSSMSFNYGESFLDSLSAVDSNSRPNQIHERLHYIHESVVTLCEKQLTALYCEPNELAYSMTEDFLDRILYSKGVQSEWENFLWKYRQDIWSEFKTLNERTKVRDDWEKLIRQCQDYNQLYKLQIQ